MTGAVAQLVARLVRNEEVRGSIPLSSTIVKLFWAEEFNRNIVRISRGYGPGIYNVLNRAMFEPQLVQSSRPIPNFTFGYTSKADVVQPNP